MNVFRVHALFPFILTLCVLLSGCGGEEVGSEDSIPTGAASVLAWDPPQTYEDSTVLDPYTELDYYEFYVREDGNFTDNDLPVAQVGATVDLLSPDGTTYIKNLTTEFDLQNLLPFVPPTTNCYLSIRAVGADGLRSQFSEPILWDQLS